MEQKPKRIRWPALALALLLLVGTVPFASAATYRAGDGIPVYLDFAPLFQLKERNAEGFPWMATEYCYSIENGNSITTNGDWLYCIDYYNHAQQGLVNSTATSLDQTPQWNNISQTAKFGITNALIYGCPRYSNEIYGYAATQLIIWEYQLGVRSAPTEVVSFFSATLDSSARLKTAYREILSQIAQHDRAPSFGGSTVTLKGYGRENGVTLKDANGLMQNDIWTVTGCGGIVAEQNGNDLFLYATEALAPDARVSVNLMRLLDTPTGNAVCAKSGAQTVILGVPADLLSTSLTVKMEATGSMTLRKTSSCGAVEGYRFKLWHKESNRILYGKADGSGNVYCTDENGNADTRVYTFSGLTDGEYSLRELLSEAPDTTVFPDAWRIVVTDKNGNTTDSYTFSAEDLIRDTNGDCCTPRFSVHGLTGGGKMTMTVNNAPTVEDLKIIKTSPDGKVSGIHFTVTDSAGMTVWSGKTDQNGALTVPKLRIGQTYTVFEEVPKGYACEENPQTVTMHNGANAVRFVNRPLLGAIYVKKTDAQDNPLPGVDFLLEYRSGDTWLPVFWCGVDESAAVGGCSSTGLTDGVLSTDENGAADFTGLRIAAQDGAITYRLTEIATRDGDALLAEPLFEGVLPDDGDAEITVTAVNCSGFLLPFTGGHGFALVPLGVALTELAVVLLLVRKMKKGKEIKQ